MNGTTGGHGRGRPRVAVFAPSPLLTVTIEAAGTSGSAEIHLHGGGQGVWIARMLAALGCQVDLCGPFGGETGEILQGLLGGDRVEVHPVATAGSNGAYVHDRRDGERASVAETAPPVLHRHELDRLYNLALVRGLCADAVVLAGPDDQTVLPAATYRRLAADLGAGNAPVVVDLVGEFLTAAAAGGVTVAKASHEDLLAAGQAASDATADLVATMRALASGARYVIVTRAEQPALALIDGELTQVRAPVFQRVDHRGAGDSMTAGITASLARGADILPALRLGAAAGALNTTRRGLATGERELIDELAERVTISPIDE